MTVNNIINDYPTHKAENHPVIHPPMTTVVEISTNSPQNTANNANK